MISWLSNPNPIATLFGPPMWTIIASLVIPGTPPIWLVVGFVAIVVSLFVEISTTAVIMSTYRRLYLRDMQLSWFERLVLHHVTYRVRESYGKLYVDGRTFWTLWKQCDIAASREGTIDRIRCIYKTIDEFVCVRENHSSEVVRRRAE